MARAIFDQSSMHYCKFSGRHSLLKKFPDFFIIGPQRTGTTWLAENLRDHPQAFMTNPKELFFFNLLNNPGHFQYSSNDLSWYLEFFCPSLKDQMKRHIATTRKYGRPFSIISRGEATASYAADTKGEIIDEILLLNPDLKVILMVRNPVLRAWSHVKKDLLNKGFLNNIERSIKQVPIDEMMSFMSAPYQLACGDYEAIIGNWGSRIIGDNLYIAFFDDIHTNPQQFLLNIFDFLGVKSKSSFFSDKLTKKISPTDKPGTARPMPEVYSEFLHDQFARNLSWLEQRFRRELVY